MQNQSQEQRMDVVTRRNAFRECMREDGAFSISVARYTLIEKYDKKSAEPSIQT